MPREHPLCQFGLLILFLQTFEEVAPSLAAAAPRFSYAEFRIPVFRLDLRLGTITHYRFTHSQADQAPRRRAGGSSRAESTCLRRSFRA